MAHDTPHDPLQEFWDRAQRHAHVGDLDVIMGKGWGESLSPPAWSFSGTAEESNASLDMVLTGKKTAISGLIQEYDEGEPLPNKGDFSIILDREGTPRALIRTTEVLVVPFGEITDDQAEAEGDDDLESWRTAHRKFWEQQNFEVTDDTQVVWERFKVVYKG